MDAILLLLVAQMIVGAACYAVGYAMGRKDRELKRLEHRLREHYLTMGQARPTVLPPDEQQTQKLPLATRGPSGAG